VDNKMQQCQACNKFYSNVYNLQKHLKRQPLCEEWVKLNPGIKDYIDDKFQLPCTDLELEEQKTKCFICNTVFANVGNLNRHLDSSLICGKWSMYKDLAPLETYIKHNSIINDNFNETFVAPKYSLCHIIWNLFIIDKMYAHLPNIEEILNENNVKYIIAILPDVREYKLEHLNINHSIMLYDDHNTQLDIKKFDAQCEKIEEIRKEENRPNIFIYCNSGYQRSIPFLCYYLLKYHQTEAPTIEKAIDLILPQIDRSNYTKTRDKYIESVKSLLQPYLISDEINENIQPTP
jgi:hypothetical protein